MCKAVSDCVEWNRLGLELGLKYSRLQKIEIERRGKNSYCMRDMISAWLRRKDKVMKEGVPTWKQLVQALKNIGEIGLSEEIMKQRKVSNPVRSVKEKSRRDLSTDEKRSVKKRKKKRRKSSDTDSDNEERGDYKHAHRYKKRKIIYKESGSDSSDNDDEKEEMTSKVKRKTYFYPIIRNVFYLLQVQKHLLAFSRVYVALVTVILQETKKNITTTTVIQRCISLIYG